VGGGRGGIGGSAIEDLGGEGIAEGWVCGFGEARVMSERGRMPMHELVISGLLSFGENALLIALPGEPAVGL
jgi:hypothetical protein